MTTKGPPKIMVSTRSQSSCYSNTHSESYTDIQKAITACVKMESDCAGVYDYRCDQGGTFELCKPCGSALWSSSTSCVYTPKLARQASGPCAIQVNERETGCVSQRVCAKVDVQANLNTTNSRWRQKLDQYVPRMSQ